MICMESLDGLLPTPLSGKIVGVASYRGDYIVVACEHGLYRLWDDGIRPISAVRTAEAVTQQRSEK